METPAGPEPCAVLAMRGPASLGPQAIEGANLRLAEFQRLSRWLLWPEPDLPRTSTGKVRRKAVAAWVQAAQTAAQNNHHAGANGFRASSDWLLALIGQITGEDPRGIGDELHLSEDLHLDSLGRVQLAAAIDERLGIAVETSLWENTHTLGELRRLLHTQDSGAPDSSPINSTDLDPHLRKSTTLKEPSPVSTNGLGGPELDSETWVSNKSDASDQQAVASPQAAPPQAVGSYLYPRWPWALPFRWLRAAFLEAVARPLVWFLGSPSVVRASAPLTAPEPMLIVSNHVTSYDGPLLEYALPGPIRRRVAVAMSGEMLEDYRHFRNPERRSAKPGFFLPGPLYYVLLTALFNVFPLPKQRDFQRSFVHAGQALDRGFHVLLFPEGTRSAEGRLARFRPGIGLLVKQSSAPVLPMAIRGLGPLKTRTQGWFRSGAVEVRIGTPIRFSPADSEAAITARLHDEVSKLLDDKQEANKG